MGSFLYSHVYCCIKAANENKPLDEILIPLPQNFSVNQTLKEFHSIFNQNVSSKTIYERLKSSFFSIFWKRYLFMMIIRLYVAISEFTGPYIMSKILHYTNSTENLQENKQYCYYYIITLIIFYFLRTIALLKYEYSLNIIRNQIEIIFADLVNSKILKIDHNIKNLEAEVSEIFGSEIGSFYHLFININYAWELPFSIGFALFLTYLQVSFAFIPGLIFAILLIFLNYYVAINIMSTSHYMKTPRTLRKQSELIAIKNIKNVKYFSLEKYFLDEIYLFRAKEFKLLTFKKYLDALCCYLWAATPLLISFITIMSYILGGNLIDSEKVFTTISLFNMIIHPLNVFPWIYSQVKGSQKSFQRICEFLKIKEKTVSIQSPNLPGGNELIKIKNLKVKYNIESEFSLEIPEFNCNKGDLIIVYGANGSGKTAFIKSLLNENIIESVSKNNKLISNSSRVAYIPQDLWTFNSSIKDNILMGEESNSDLYSKIINACSLETDLKTMKNHDHTIISTKGSNISGGQKQRVNIARSFCSNPDILIMDNPFSSIDNNVAEKIFRDFVLGLKDKGVCVIFSTCDRKWINMSNKVYQINKNKLIKLKINENEKDSNYINYDYSKNKEENNQEIKNEQINVKVDDKNENKFRVEYKTYDFYFNETGKIFFLLVILFVGLMQFGRNFIEIWLARWVNNENLKNYINDEKIDIQSKNLYYYILFIILHSIATIGRSAFFAVAGLKAAKSIYQKFTKKLLFSKCNYFTKFDLGIISNILENDVKCLDEELPTEFNRLLAYSFTVAGTIIVIGYSSLSFLVCKIILIKVFVILGFYYVYLFRIQIPAAKRLSKESNKNYSELMNKFFDIIDGRVIIRSFKKEVYFRQVILDCLEKKMNSSHTEQLIGKWMGMRLDFISYSLSSLIALLMGYCIYNDDYKAISFFSLALTYSLNINFSLSSLLPWINEVEHKFTAIQRIRHNMISMKEEDFNNLKKGFNYKSNKILEINNVSMKYEDESINVLKNIKLLVKKGQKVGLIGRTGAGKTSIFNTIIRLYPSDKGEVLFKGVNVNEIDISILRKDILVISRDPLIVEGTLAKNIDLYGRYNLEQIKEFLNFNFEDLLKINEFSFLRNLDFEIKSEGSNLSEGQKSIIQIIRGIISKPCLMCMDEFNAELDDETGNKKINKLENLILDIIFKKFKEITIIAIVHKLNVLKKFDFLYVIENGEIIEQGTPLKILKKSNLKEIISS